jgi:hypothetical protein
MAQDPEEERREGGQLDTSHELDMVTIYESNAADAENEAEIIHSLLEANGIPATLVRGYPLPPAGFIIQVPANRLQDARTLIDEARDTGPEGAAEAEAEGEQ